MALALLIAWLPLQTPLAIVVFQYGHAEGLARAMLLAKDVFTAAADPLLLRPLLAEGSSSTGSTGRPSHTWRCSASTRSSRGCSVRTSGVASVVASVRELGVPVELYALGRLALAAGADIRLLVRWFLVVSALAAAFTVGVWALLPATFWASTLDLVGFVRVVQGIPNALTIWDISLVAHFGGGASTIYSRAVGPFTQPVGTAHYFVLPLDPVRGLRSSSRSMRDAVGTF